jgi:hypothetical protein
VNARASVVDVPSGCVTVTSTVPVACAGVVAVSSVSEMKPVWAATPPKLATVPGANPAPSNLTTVPPLIGPRSGKIFRSVSVGCTVTMDVAALFARTRSYVLEDTLAFRTKSWSDRDVTRIGATTSEGANAVRVQEVREQLQP